MVPVVPVRQGPRPLSRPRSEDQARRHLLHSFESLRRVRLVQQLWLVAVERHLVQHGARPLARALLHEPPRAVKDAVESFHGLLSPLFDEKMRALAQTMRNHNGRSVIGFALMRSWSFKEAPARNALDIALRNVLDQHSQRRRSTAPRCTLRHEVVKSVLLDKPLFLLEDDKSTAKEVWNSCKDIRRANISQIADVECFMFPETIQFLFNFQCSIVGTVVVACRIVPHSASGTLWFHFPFENRFCKLFLCQYSRTM